MRCCEARTAWLRIQRVTNIREHQYVDLKEKRNYEAFMRLKKIVLIPTLIQTPPLVHANCRSFSALRLCTADFAAAYSSPNKPLSEIL